MSGSLTVDLSPWMIEMVAGRWSSTATSSLGELELAAGESGIPGEVGVVDVVGGVEEGAREVVELWVRWI